MERTLKDIEKDLERAEKELEPVQKLYNKKLKTVNGLEYKLLQYKLTNGIICICIMVVRHIMILLVFLKLKAKPILN